MTPGDSLPARIDNDHLRLSALHPDFGVEVSAVDLREPLSTNVGRALCAALWQHSLLVFRGQPLSNPALERVGRHLGARQSEVKRFEAAGPSPDQRWHCVGAINGDPAIATVLCPRSAPLEGGGMAFVSTRTALEALSKDQRDELANLTAVHTFHGDPARQEKHALTVAHPHTAHSSLFLGYHVRAVEGLASGESDALIGRLMAQATRPDAVYRHDFRPGDVLIWDNWSLMHRACALAEGEHRVVEEISILP